MDTYALAHLGIFGNTAFTIVFGMFIIVFLATLVMAYDWYARRIAHQKKHKNKPVHSMSRSV